MLRPDGKQAALGRFDGAVVVLDTADGKVVAQPLPVKPKPPVIAKLTPNAGPRGQTVQVILSGEQLEGATEIVAEEPGLTIHKPSAKTLKFVTALVTIPATARLGSYKLRAKNAAGTSAPVEFFVDRFKSVPYMAPGLDKPLVLPVTVTGTLGEAGDVDRYVLVLAPDQQIGVQLVSTKAKLDAILRMVDRQGKILAESNNGLLGFTAPHKSLPGTRYVLELRDRDYRGNKDMAYRLHLGDIPVVTSIFPLGISGAWRQPFRCMAFIWERYPP